MGTSMMKCGHAANAVMKNKPVCAICIGIVPGADIVAEDQPDLSGRVAKCPYCKKHAPSSLGLAFFEHRPGSETDYYYCGCRGWD